MLTSTSLRCMGGPCATFEGGAVMYRPGDCPKTHGFYSIQDSLWEMGADLHRTGCYDAETVAAVLEVKGAAGLGTDPVFDVDTDIAISQAYDAMVTAGTRPRLGEAPAPSSGTSWLLWVALGALAWKVTR